MKKINVSDLQNTESSLHENPSHVVSGILKVKEQGYLPPGVFLRKCISPYLMTVDFEQDRLAMIQDDPKVESVSVSKGLRRLKG